MHSRHLSSNSKHWSLIISKVIIHSRCSSTKTFSYKEPPDLKESTLTNVEKIIWHIEMKNLNEWQALLSSTSCWWPEYIFLLLFRIWITWVVKYDTLFCKRGNSINVTVGRCPLEFPRGMSPMGLTSALRAHCCCHKLYLCSQRRGSTELLFVVKFLRRFLNRFPCKHPLR